MPTPFTALKIIGPSLILVALLAILAAILHFSLQALQERLTKALRERRRARGQYQSPPWPTSQQQLPLPPPLCQQAPPLAIPVYPQHTPAPFAYHLRPTILTPAEISFFHILRSLTPYYIVPKLRLADLFTADHQGAFNKISAKHIDFLLCDPNTMQPILAIELDDKSHNRPDRQERDALVNAIFQQAGLYLIRFPVLPAYQPQAIKQVLESHINAQLRQ